MYIIEMIAWFTFGFAPTLGIGNAVWSHFDKKRGNLIPWKI
jgi:hypothetical protein